MLQARRDEAAFEGITIDLSRVMACPYASMILAELGATVIKVEQPGIGDETCGSEPLAQGLAGEKVSGYYLVPMKFEGWDQPEATRPPLFGEHTDEVLRGLGYDEARIATLRESGAI